MPKRPREDEDIPPEVQDNLITRGISRVIDRPTYAAHYILELLRKIPVLEKRVADIESAKTPRHAAIPPAPRKVTTKKD